MATNANNIPLENLDADKPPAEKIIHGLISKELIFAVVGPAGSGTSWIADALKNRVSKAICGEAVHIIKASKVISERAREAGHALDEMSKLKRSKILQDVGDEIRKEDPAGVALGLIREIKNIRDSEKRAANDSQTEVDVERVFILDSLKNPAEAELLRRVYQDAFCLIGVVCEDEKRGERLQNDKCRDSSAEEIDRFIERDADSGLSHGQKVVDTFHLSDFFVDNTPDRFTDKDRETENPQWDVNDQLGRLIDILTHTQLVRPKPNETGMFHAYGAKMRSACLSRQVGAALMDKSGNVVSTGANEAPRAGGGVYGYQGNMDPRIEQDGRCATYNKYCSNTRQQVEIVQELVDAVPALKGADIQELRSLLKATTLGRLVEFSRAVHAEMDAILSAARQGASPVGGRLFVTTFPCHYCARHIVTSGVDEVQYIEPYPKSKALKLHGDAIALSAEDWVAPSEIAFNSISELKKEKSKKKVLFRPFTGVAPRFYKRAFFKDRPLKDSQTGEMMFGSPAWKGGLLKHSYTEIENLLIKSGEPT